MRTIKIVSVLATIISVLFAGTAFASPIVWVVSYNSAPSGTGLGVVSVVDVDNAYAVSDVMPDLAGPQTISISPDQTKAYIADRDDDVIYVVNTANFSTIATISTPNDGEISITPDGTKGYVTDRHINQLIILDLVNNTATGATIPVVNFPYFHTISPDGSTLYASAFNHLYKIDVASDTITSSMPLNGGQDLAVSDDSATLYVIAASSDIIAVIDTASFTISDTVDIGGDPSFGAGMDILTLVPGVSKLYASDSDASKVYVIDTATLTITSTINLGGSTPWTVAVSPSGAHAFVVQNAIADGTSEVSVIDTSTDALVETVTVTDAFWAFSLAVVDREYTTTGSSVTVNPSDTSTTAEITFSNVSTTGDTVITSTTTAPVLPTGFSLNNDSLYFDLSTSAVWTGSTTVCINYTDETDEENLKFLHEEAGIWVDRTSSLDTVNNRICADVTSFSLFAVAIKDITSISIDIKPGSPENTINLGSNGVVPVALFGSAVFDASLILPETVTLASSPVKLKGKGTAMFTLHDVNNDGFTDMTVHIETDTLQLSEESETAVLQGTLSDGTVFEGTDLVRIVQ